MPSQTTQDVVHLPIDLRDYLKILAKATAISSLTDVLGAGGSATFALTDIGGTHSDSKYEVYSTYLVGADAARDLLARLRLLKRDWGIDQRTITYKGRRGIRKPGFHEEWVTAFRRTRGLLINLCLDRRIFGTGPAREQLGSLKSWLWTSALDVKRSVAARIGYSMTFLAFIGDWFKPADRLVWITDTDEIHSGAAGPLLHASFQSLLATVSSRGPIDGALEQLPPDGDARASLRDLLSLPDLAAGVLPAFLPTPFEDGALHDAPDGPAREILEGVGRLPAPYTRLTSETQLVTVVVSQEPDGPGAQIASVGLE